MAPSIQPFLRLLFVVLLLGVLPAPAAARPCKTLVISSSTISFHPNFPYQNNPNSAGTARILTISTEIRQFNLRPLTFLAATEDPGPLERASRFGLGLGFDPDSLRDSTMDVLSVVVALLFGIGCGAFTAATMCLGWSLFSNRRRYSDLDYDDFEYNDGDMSPKKAGNVKIPPPTADLSLLGDLKILPGDATSAADVKIPLCIASPDAAPAGDVKIPPSPAGDVKIPLCNASPDVAPAGDVKIPSSTAGDVKIPLCNAPPDAAPAGNVKILPSPAGDVKIPPSLADAPPADASSAGNVKTPPRPVDASRADVAGAPLPALPRKGPTSPSYSYSSTDHYWKVRRRPGLPRLFSCSPSYYYEPCIVVANEAVQEAQKN